MAKNQKKLALSLAILLGLSMSYAAVSYAARPVDLSHQPISTLQSFLSSPTALAIKNGVQIEEISRSIDFKQTLHLRIQQTYSGYPVWGGDAIVHVPHTEKATKSLVDTVNMAKNNHGSMEGILYQNIAADLVDTPQYVFTAAQSKKALQHAVNIYEQKFARGLEIADKQSALLVFIDQDNKAHWAYKISFDVAPVKPGMLPAKPVYIMDAISLQVYATWDDVKTFETVDTLGGGFGGNKKMGKRTYDGLTGDFPQLNIKRDISENLCYLQNSEVTVKHYRGGKVVTFNCANIDSDHNGVYWDGETDAVNGGYSPSNDALYGGAVIKGMYMQWYGLAVLTENGKPMMLTMVVHDPIDNAFWDGRKMTFGDGVRMFYPLTSLGVAAHEISHGFTEQNSNLRYYGQSGGMNEAFSDIAAQAAEFYAYGNNSWQIGPEIFKEEGRALRYMDQPSKDCYGKSPGNWCSIDDVSQYYTGLDVHFSSGIFNRFFYLLGTTSNWNTRKAFDVMVHANHSYWTSNSTFTSGACGIIKSTKDYGYEIDDVKTAFAKVGIDTSNC